MIAKLPSQGDAHMPRPTIILVHGFWGGAAHWTKVILELSRMGYDDIHAVDNPLASLADDAARTGRLIAKHPRDSVILVGHSYGGAVITEAGNAPNVAGLVYLAAFAPDSGESVGQIAAAGPAPMGAANLVPDGDGGIWINIKKFHQSFCQDLTEEEGLVMAVTQKPPAAGIFGDALTRCAWKEKPAWYQISSEDRMLHPDNQRRMAGRMGARKIVTLPASHASLASRPAEICALIDEAARAAA
jgi:pimeloyl-ACP methyl ester carboxylesterase